MNEGSKRSGISRFALMLAGAAFIAAPVWADSGAALGPAALESNTWIFKLLLTQSSAAQRIPQNGNSLAHEKLIDVQLLYAKTGADANAGRPKLAIKLLDQAALEMVTAARIVPDTEQQAQQERARYAELRELVQTSLHL